MSLPYQEKLIPCAKELRKNATKQENHLWYDFLCHYPVRFQRQKTIDHFIADFYCHAAKLIVELDGSQHYEEQGIERDKERTAILEQYGLKVIRFSNLEIKQNFQGVCTAIDLAVKERMRAFAEALPQSPTATAPSKREPFDKEGKFPARGKASLLEGGGTATAVTEGVGLENSSH